MDTAAETRQVPSDARLFRPHRSFLYVSVIGLICFSIVSCVFAFFPDGFPNGFLKRSVRHRELEAFISYTLFLGLLLLYTCGIVFYFRKRLLLTSKEVIQRGFFRTQSFAIEDVARIKWPHWRS